MPLLIEIEIVARTKKRPFFSQQLTTSNNIFALPRPFFGGTNNIGLFCCYPKCLKHCVLIDVVRCC